MTVRPPSRLGYTRQDGLDKALEAGLAAEVRGPPASPGAAPPRRGPLRPAGGGTAGGGGLCGALGVRFPRAVHGESDTPAASGGGLAGWCAASASAAARAPATVVLPACHVRPSPQGHASTWHRNPQSIQLARSGR
jgi:hypothetical protein